MRTANQKKPDDPKCRDWNAREGARRVGQNGFGTQVADSTFREVTSVMVRAQKAGRREAQQAADQKEAARQKAEREALAKV